jgi:hypothetical protein
VDTSGWERCDLPGLGLSFRYPAVTPSGAPVELDDVRIHFQSRGTNEVYAEVSQHSGVSAADFFAREREFAVERLGATVEPLEPTTFAGRSAWRYAFAFDGKRREFVLVEDGDRAPVRARRRRAPRARCLYRVVHDPTSELSRAVADSVRLP